MTGMIFLISSDLHHKYNVGYVIERLENTFYQCHQSSTQKNSQGGYIYSHILISLGSEYASICPGQIHYYFWAYSQTSGGRCTVVKKSDKKTSSKDAFKWLNKGPI